MSLQKIANGLHEGLLKRDQLIFSVIAEKYQLNEEEVSKFVYESLDADKTLKSMKLQTRQPKGNRRHKTKSGYQKFCDDNRDRVKHMLKTEVKERTFKNKQGQTKTISVEDFKQGEPRFEHITQKCASMWWLLSEDERAEYVRNASTSVAETETSVSVSESVSTKATKKKGKGRKAEIVLKEEKEKPAKKTGKKASKK
jgi:hypothetical protein